MQPPETWVDAFNFKAILGGLFVGLIMTPASMYMQLVTGSDVGPAAQWVTIILFLEVARRSFTSLSRPEIYILYYMAGATLISSGPGSGLLWQQFLVQSEEMRKFGIADKIPTWYAPHSPDVLGSRSFFNPAWYVPIGLMGLGMLLSRLDNFGLGYIMYRITSDVEKLPFPMAPVGAAGVTALADASGRARDVAMAGLQLRGRAGHGVRAGLPRPAGRQRRVSAGEDRDLPCAVYRSDQQHRKADPGHAVHAQLRSGPADSGHGAAVLGDGRQFRRPGGWASSPTRSCITSAF